MRQIWGEWVNYRNSVRLFWKRSQLAMHLLLEAASTPAIRSPIDILMVTTMALVWTVNSTLSWGCNYVMQWNLGWLVAKKKTAAHTFCTRLLFHLLAAKACHTNEPAESVLQCNAKANSPEAAKFQNSIFLPLEMPPLAQCRQERMPPSPPLPAATVSDIENKTRNTRVERLRWAELLEVAEWC